MIRIARMLGIIVLLALCAVPLAGCDRYMTGGMVVEYQRVGGIAGYDDHLIIWDDGMATLNRKGVRSEFQVDTETINQVLDAVSKVDWNKLSKEPAPRVQGADLIEYTITFQRRIVHVVDTAIPPELQSLIQILNRVIDNAGKP